MEEAIIKRVMPHSLEAVSYTHLDVYKRQQEGPVAAEAVSGGTEYGASHAGTASAADGSVGTVPALFRHRPGTGAERSVRG